MLAARPATSRPNEASLPVISVILPTYRGEATLSRAVRSVLEQTVRELELIVVVNGGNEPLRDLAHELARDDDRIRVLFDREAGLPRARMRGLEAAKYPWVALQDDDDVSHPERFGELLAAVTHDPKLVLVGGWAIVHDEAGALREPFHHATRDFDLRLQLRAGPCPWVATTVMFRREDALAVGGFTDRFPRCDDYCLWARLAARGRLANVPRHLAAYRHHDPSLRADYLEEQRRGHVALQAHYFRPLSRLEDQWLRFQMRRLARIARARVAIDWPEELLRRHGLATGDTRSG